MSDTPRTDAAAWTAQDGNGNQSLVPTDFARQLERELTEANEMIRDADEDCARHNLYTTEESLRAAKAIAEFRGEDPKAVFASMHDRIWFIEMARQLAVLRAALDDIHTTAHCLAKAGPLTTPTLDTAWGHFMDIEVKAVAALAASRTPPLSPTPPSTP